MLIFGTIGIGIALTAIWSVKNKQNGFLEIVKLLRGEPAFIPEPMPTVSGETRAIHKDAEKNEPPAPGNETYTPT